MGEGPRRLHRPDPALRSDRLLLRAWAAEDAAALAAAWDDPAIARWTAVPSVPDRLAAAQRWIAQNASLVERGRSLDLVIDVRGSVAGEVGLTVDRTRRAEVPPELGWWVAASHRGRGLASEAVALVAGWALSAEGLGLPVLDAVCADANVASGAVARNAGFEPSDRPAPPGSTVWTRRAVRGTPGPPGTVHP